MSILKDCYGRCKATANCNFEGKYTESGRISQEESPWRPLLRCDREEGMAQMNKWKSWVEGLGDAVVNPGTPFMGTKIVTSGDVQDDTDPNSMKGYAVVKAEDMDAAVEITKTDPFLDNGGTIRLSQVMEMP